MKKHYFVIFFTLLILSCTTTVIRDKQSWSKKPMFASLMINGIQYTLSSPTNKYSVKNPTQFVLTLKNTSSFKKKFKITKDKFLICKIRNRMGQIDEKIIVKASDIIQKKYFIILPNEERKFDFSIKIDDEIVSNNEYLYCKTNLYFLKRQFRRNALTVYLEKE